MGRCVPLSLYLHDAFEGLKSGSAVRHLVVDEMGLYPGTVRGPEPAVPVRQDHPGGFRPVH